MEVHPQVCQIPDAVNMVRNHSGNTNDCLVKTECGDKLINDSAQRQEVHYLHQTTTVEMKWGR